MKNLIVVLLTFFSLTLSWAQQKEGVISYEKKINLWKRVPEDRRSYVPEFRTTKHNLFFTDSTSLYKTIKEEEEMNPFGGGEGGGMRMMASMMGLNADVYKTYNQGLSITAQEQAGKNFLIIDTIKKLPWKITNETKLILGYNCRKATLKQKMGSLFGMPNNPRNQEKREESTPGSASDTAKRNGNRWNKEMDIEAWYAEKIIAPVGPDAFGQLPGAVLAIDIDNGFMVYTATEVKKEFPSKELKEPKKGKKVTREEYNKMIMEMMRNFSGGNGTPPAH